MYGRFSRNLLLKMFFGQMVFTCIYIHIYIYIWVWVKIRYPNDWMVNTKLDISICGPTSVFHFDPHPCIYLMILMTLRPFVFYPMEKHVDLWSSLG